MAGTALDDLYDEIPYPDLCHGYTHPGRLAAIGQLLGIATPPVHECRVLEIGCAGGGNLLPMAFALPGATFVGIDLSTPQIHAAKESTRLLGPRNVDFHALDLMDVTAELGTFDYVIAHGVYSWVPADVRDRLLSVCRQHLSTNGIAYVSYNALPGWHMVLMVREMMLHHTRHLTEPRARAQAGRAFIRQLRSAIPDTDQSVFAAFLDAYVETHLGHFPGNEAWEDSALLHDELSAVNEPLYFHEFVAHAERHGLQHLADATFPQSMTGDLPVETVDQLRAMSSDPIDFEQHVDYLVQQSFRRSLLCHADVRIERPPRPANVRNLYVATRARWVDEDGAFVSSDGASYTPEHPVTTAALRVLSEASPQAIHFPTLLADACARVESYEPDESTADRLATDLLDVASSGNQQAELLAYDPVLAAIPSERPRASPVAMMQSSRSSTVSNLRHEQMALNGLSRAILPLLDGHHTRADVLRELLAMLGDGRLNGPPNDDRSPEQIERALSRDIDLRLQWLARAAILVE